MSEKRAAEVRRLLAEREPALALAADAIVDNLSLEGGLVALLALKGTPTRHPAIAGVAA